MALYHVILDWCPQDEDISDAGMARDFSKFEAHIRTLQPPPGDWKLLTVSQGRTSTTGWPEVALVATSYDLLEFLVQIYDIDATAEQLHSFSDTVKAMRSGEHPIWVGNKLYPANAS